MISTEDANIVRAYENIDQFPIFFHVDLKIHATKNEHLFY